MVSALGCISINAVKINGQELWNESKHIPEYQGIPLLRPKRDRPLWIIAHFGQQGRMAPDNFWPVYYLKLILRGDGKGGIELFR